MSNKNNKTPRTRNAKTGRYAEDYLANLYPHLYVVEFDVRTKN